MMRYVLTAILAGYLGAGLSLGLVMAQVLPLTAFGVGAYAATWPVHVYCAQPGAGCFGKMQEWVPFWIGRYMFDLRKAK